MVGILSTHDMLQETRNIPDGKTTNIIPAYVSTEEDFDIPTTSCKANITTVVQTAYRVMHL